MAGNKVTTPLLISGFLLLAFFGGAAAGPLEDGIASSKRGDYPTAIQLLKPLAEQGSVDAQFELGKLYVRKDGYFDSSNKAGAAFWFRKAADQGHAEAQYDLGFLYENGAIEPEHDLVQAFIWYLKAAEQGFADAQFQIATRYEYGRGVPQNYALAVAWVRKSADHGDTMSQDRLAQYYAKGQGVPQDYVQAHMWWNVAASRESDYRLREVFVTSRDKVAAEMTPAQIIEAQRMASEWVPK